MHLLFRLLSILPLSLLHNLGALLGWLVWLLSPKYRRHLKDNMAQAGVSALRAEAICAAGQSLAELPKIWLRPQEEVVRQVVKATGQEVIEAAWASGKGIVYVTPHLGCFEIVGQYLASFRPITTMYRPPKKAWLHSIFKDGRSANLKLATADMAGVRTFLRTLRQGEAVGILPDQVPGKGEGIWAPFFGKPAFTMTLAARLADTGSTIILTYAERLPYGAGYHIHFRPLSAPLEGSLDEKVAQLNREIEHSIMQCPGQYLWSYNRYKVPAQSTEKPTEKATEKADAA